MHAEAHLDVGRVASGADAVGGLGYPAARHILGGHVVLGLAGVAGVADDGLLAIAEYLVQGEQEAAHLAEAYLELLVGQRQPGVKRPHAGVDPSRGHDASARLPLQLLREDTLAASLVAKPRDQVLHIEVTGGSHTVDPALR